MIGTLLKIYRGENLKYRHTITGKLWILMPVLTLLLAYGISQNFGINSAFNWWYTLMLPGTVTLFTCLAGEKDRKMKNRAVLAMPIDMGSIWDSKILAGIRVLALANLVAAAGNLALGRYLVPRFWMNQVMEISPAQTAAAAAVMTVTILWQVPFCLWLDQKWGLFPALIINMILNTTGTVMAVSSYWLLNPWAVLPRLMTAVVGILPNCMPAVPGSETYFPGITDPSSILPGILVTIVWFGVLWAISRIWYKRKGALTV